jgi:hypothetical protein
MESRKVSVDHTPTGGHFISHAERGTRSRALATRCLALSMITVALGAVFICCFLLADSVPTDSDGAAIVLQARAMLHGNLLLRGWQLSDVSFYLTELPEYMLVVAIRGLRPDVVQICAALTYTLCLLFVVLVAKGNATGREAVVRVAMSAGIALAPIAIDQRTLLTNPDHTGSAVPILLMLLLIQSPSLRYRKLAITVVVLSAALISDQLIFVIGIAPLLTVCLVRCRFRIRYPEYRQERLLMAAACASAVIGLSVPRIIKAAGGWATSAIPATFVGFGSLWGNFLGAVHGLLILFGVQFTPQLGLQTAFSAIRLTGLILVVVAVLLGIRSIRPFRDLVQRDLVQRDLVEGVLAAAIMIDFAAYVLFIPDPTANFREIDTIVLLGAALAGRMLAGPLIRMRLQGAIAVVMACYAVTLAWGLAQPTRPVANFSLGNWLSEHSLTDGIAGYWTADPIIVDTGGAVQLAAVQLNGRQASPYLWETNVSAFNPGTHYANFLLINPPSGTDPHPITEREAVDAFGSPSQVYGYQGYIIIVWRKNLLKMLQLPSAPGTARWRR